MNIFLILSMRYHSKGDVIRYDWSANVNGWNVSIEDFHKKMIEQNITVFNATQGDWTYYITPGDDLNAYEDQMPLFNPSWISGLDANLYYVSVIRCNSRKQFCQVCITLNDWDWGFVSPSKPDQGGVIYMADGQPIKLGTGASDPYITVDVDFIFNYGSTIRNIQIFILFLKLQQHLFQNLLVHKLQGLLQHHLFHYVIIINVLM